MDENRKRYIIATYRIQRCMETLCMYADDGKVQEYLEKIEECAEYYAKEEAELVKGVD